MSDNNRFRRGSKGYYIALILCAAAIGITSYVYYRNADPAEPISAEETYLDVPVGTLATEDIPAIATQPQPSAQSTLPPSADATVPTPTAAPKQTLKTMFPVSGTEIFGYSMEALSYNQTTRDWRVHNGIDLAAETGAQVCAAADGEVYSVREDEALGHTVVIRHSSGYTTTYSSLAPEIRVKAGDTVTMGQIIGCVSDSAIVESALGSHVHFSVTHYDEPMDPAAFFSLGQ